VAQLVARDEGEEEKGGGSFLFWEPAVRYVKDVLPNTSPRRALIVIFPILHLIPQSLCNRHQRGISSNQ
jgi:hypothetical protein